MGGSDGVESGEQGTGSGEVLTDQVLATTRAWDGTPYEHYATGTPLLSIVRFRIPPHRSLPWHRHVVPNAAFVIQGSMTLEDRETGVSQTIRIGEGFGESVGAVRRGSTGAEGVEVVVTYAGVEGLPLSISPE